ncbi:hypothetical protein RGQ29_024793 [Quercus rubra]|uniref:DUF3741 domain-containing protein n=1 Tax=Quercus rubra TaxID=3512 RepID=A0AAN7INY3_QUERU|nr:hypothetical protein RGQ29_024793 [Quercus rubra]
MKRQDTLVSSSSYRENVAAETLHAKSIGCMSGIIQLVSKYQNRRKSLTFGKKQEKNVVSSPTKQKPSVPTQEASPSSMQPQNQKQKDIKPTNDLRRLSCDVPRSPTLPAEIRRSNSVNSPQNFRTPPALVARLMGLEAMPTTMTVMPESAAEKRRKLLMALEKCNEDLNALKKIIDTVQFSEGLSSTAEIKRCWEEQPSPVSVLDEFMTRSPLMNAQCNSRRHTNGRVQHQPKQLKKKPGEEEVINVYVYDRMTTDSVQTKGEKNDASSPIWSSKALKDSIDEVCRDIAWGEKRETGRIGVTLQEYICKDLIEEIVTEMGCCDMYALPFEACKRRLCF